LPAWIDPVSDPLKAIENAEVIITAGPILENPAPSIQRAWLGASYLLLPIDFDSYVQAEAVANADLLLVDDVAQFEYYRANGHCTDWTTPHAGVGDGLRRNLGGNGIVCCNLGVGLLDAAFAKDVFDRACASHIGMHLSL
jgi:ornithine cyclodeaminase/alanine dehydrogenase-like protein (mu-crystallin family)